MSYPKFERKADLFKNGPLLKFQGLNLPVALGSGLVWLPSIARIADLGPQKLAFMKSYGPVLWKAVENSLSFRAVEPPRLIKMPSGFKPQDVELWRRICHERDKLDFIRLFPIAADSIEQLEDITRAIQIHFGGTDYRSPLTRKYHEYLVSEKKPHRLEK